MTPKTDEPIAAANHLTPRTEHALKQTQGLFRTAAAANRFADFARQLERELAEARELLQDALYQKLVTERDQLRVDLEGLKQSILDLSHPNCRMLLRERDEAREQLRIQRNDINNDWFAEERLMVAERDQLRAKVADYKATIAKLEADKARLLVIFDRADHWLSCAEDGYSGIAGFPYDDDRKLYDETKSAMKEDTK